MSSHTPLDGQIALVTGASRGIGRAVALRLGALGAQVVVHYHRRREAAEQVRAAIVAAGGPCPVVLAADLADPPQAARLVARVQAEVGPVRVLVNNAGIRRRALAHQMSDADWSDVLAVNLTSAFYACRAVLPAMRAARAGHIVNVAAAPALVADPGAVSYVAAKQGLVGLTRGLAAENAAHGIRVHAVAPGLTDTDMLGHLDDDARAALAKRIPVGRIAEPAEVASAVSWLVTEGTYTTGATLTVSGGMAGV